MSNPPDSSVSPPPDSSADKSPPPSENSSPPPSDNSSPPPNDNSSPPPTNNSSPPPTDNSSPPPKDNSASPPPPPASKSSPPPPPPKSSSSPPPSSTPSPPPPNSSKSSPPSDSFTPPPDSDSPPPPPPPDSSTPPPSDSSTPPPTEKSPPPSHAKSPPPPPPSEFVPPPTDQFSPPPPLSDNAPPPPPPLSDNAPPPPPPKHHHTPPPATPPTQQTPIAPPTGQTPLPNGTTPAPSTSTTPHSPPSPSSTTPHSPPSHGPTTSPLVPPDSPPPDSKGAAIGGAVAGLVIIAFLAIFLIARRRKKRSAVYATQYMPPNSFSSKSDGFYMHNSGPQSASGFYPQPQQSFHGNPMGLSYGGSQRGNSYYQGPPTETNAIGSAQSLFTYEELMEITNGFSQQNIIGEGGFGCVYKGSLRDGRVVAVKQLKKGSGQGEREFRAEVEIISRVHHRYLVSLVGYCICDTQRLLIYEYVPNQTLEHHLHGKDMPVLEWTKRLRIALGAARGLAYLHDDCHPKIIHRDIKSANILLDDAYESQVADFGLAKLTDDTNTHVSTRVMGTFGYMAPEYASSGKLTDRSDVFSFGVVLLELITGRKSVDQTQPLGDESLVEWARPLLGRALDTGDFTEIVDSRLEKHYVEAEMFRMVEAAAACVRHSAPKRPRMKQVARALDCEEEASDLSNGVKYGQSTIYESGQYNQDISRFRKMAFGSGGSKEFDTYSGDYTTSIEITDTSSEVPSCESETQAMNARNGDGGRRFS